MLIIPAIDLEGGCVVRYVQGRRDKKVYSRNPLQTAKHWVKQGAELIHLVDLDGAFSGKPKNLEIVKEIAKGINIPVECGGGIRTQEAIKDLLDSGVYRVILGTKAVQDINFLKNVFKKYKDKIIVSIDGKDELIQVKGWKESTKGKGIVDFALLLEEMGCRELIYTDTLKDGTLKGPNIKSTKALLRAVKISIIASGGISSLDDIRKLKGMEKIGLSGIIIGKALYEGKFTLRQAIDA